jgi:hypothetical protein
MNKPFIEYKILDDPFTEQGPILIGNPVFSSVGLKIQFLPQGQEPWVANLAKDMGNFNEVHYLNSPNVLVVAGSIPYIVNVVNKTAEQIDSEVCEAIAEADDGSIVVAHQTVLSFVAPDGTHWKSKQISMDGFKDIEIQGNVVRGLSWSPMTKPGQWIPFTFNLQTKEINGGSYQVLHSLPKADKS